MRVFSICGRSLDDHPGGADSLLNFLFSSCQRIVRDVQRALFYLGFDYTIQRFERIGYFLLTSRISQPLDFNSRRHGFAQTRIGWMRFVLHAYKIRLWELCWKLKSELTPVAPLRKRAAPHFQLAC